MANKKNKKKKEVVSTTSSNSKSGSIVSRALSRRDEMYENDAKGQKIASDTRRKSKSYYGENKKYSDTEYQRQSESRLMRIAEQASDVQKRNSRNTQKYRDAVKLLKKADKAENAMRSESYNRAKREQASKELRTSQNGEAVEQQQKRINLGTSKYKDPSKMGLEEINKALESVEKQREQAHKMMASYSKNGDAVKQGWDDAKSAEEVGADKETFENYKIWHNRELSYSHYLDELKEQLPTAQKEAEYSKLSDSEKETLTKAIDYKDELGGKFEKVRRFTETGVSELLEGIDAARVEKAYPELKEMRERGIDVDYLIKSEIIKRNNEKQEERNKKTQEFADEHPVLGSVGSIGTNLLSVVETVKDIEDGIERSFSDKEYEMDYQQHPYSQFTQNTRQKVSEGINNGVGKFVYNAGMSTLDSAAALLATKGLSKTGEAASLLMGTNAANQSYIDTIERGGNATEAITTGISAGLIEMLSEKYSIDSFEALKTATVKSGKTFAKNLAKQSLTEASEEMVSDVANQIVDSVVNGNKSDYNQIVKEYIEQGYSKSEAKKMATKDFYFQVVEDGAAGAFSGALFGTYGNVYSKVNYKKVSKNTGKNIEANGETENLLSYAAKNNMDTDLQEGESSTEKIGKTVLDIVEDAEGKIKSTGSSIELAAMYEQLTDGVPASIGTEIDMMVREKAMTLAKSMGRQEKAMTLAKSMGIKEKTTVLTDMESMTSEKERLYDLMSTATNNAMIRTVEVNKKRRGQNGNNEYEDMQAESEQEIDAGIDMENMIDDKDRESNVENENLSEVPKEYVKNRTEENFQESKRAAFTASDEKVEVKGFREIGTKEATVETEDGEVVKMSDLSFEDEGTQQMFNIASTMDSAIAATVLVDSYNGKDNAAVYANNFRAAYNFGYQGSIDYNTMMNASADFRTMSNPDTMRMAYKLGQAHAENEKAKETVKNVKRKGKGEYTDVRDEYSKNDGFDQLKKELAKKTGMDVYDFEKMDGEDAEVINAYMDIERGQMAFSEAAENKFIAMIHESLEFASVMSEEDYKKMMGTVLKYMVDKHGSKNVHDLIQSYKHAYENVEGSKTFSEAAEEMINDAVSGVFYDEQGAKKFIDWLMGNKSYNTDEKKSIFKKIARMLKHVYEKIKKYIDETPMTKVARLAAELNVEQKEEIQQMFMEAVDKAGEKYRELDSNNRSEEKRYSVKVIPDTIQDDIETNIQDVINMPIASRVKETEFSKGKIKLVDQVAKFFDEIGNNAYNEMLGDVELSRKGVKDDISHGLGRAKAISFRAIPDIIKNGKIVNYSGNYKGKGHARVVIAAPIEIVGSQEKICGKYIMAVVLRRENAKQRFYMHEVATIKRDELLFKTRTYNKVISNPSNNPSLEEILTNIAGNVKNNINENKDIRYSISVDLDKQIDDVLNDTVPKDYTHVYLGETTKALKELGWNNLPMLMTNQHVYSTIKTQEEAKKENRFSRRRNYHGLGKELFEKVQKQLNTPAMIIKSNTNENNADVVLMTNVKDKQGNVVIVAIKPSGTGRFRENPVIANVVLSLYGKKSIQKFIEIAQEENRIIKINPDEAVMPMVQFHGVLPHQDYSDNLAQYKKIVKNIISDEGDKYSSRVSEYTENNGEVESEGNIRYSISVDLNKQIDNVLNDTVPKDYTHVYLGETTKALKELGWNNLPMLMTNQHVYSTIKTQEEAKKENRFSRRRNYHGLGKELFEKVQKQLNTPAMIIKSNTNENNADVVLMTNVKDKQGNVVIVAIKPSGSGRVKGEHTIANVVLSLYGKQSIQKFVETARKEKRIIKTNPDEAVWPMVQFHGGLLHQDYSDNLAQYKKIVKNTISDEGKKYSIFVKERTDNLRHSLVDTMTTEESLIQENEQLKKVVETLESEFKPGKKTVPEPADVERVSKKLLRKYHSSFDAETLQENLTKLYAYMNEEGADYSEALKITSEIARGVLEKSTTKDTTMYDTYKDLRDYFRKTKLTLSEAQKSEVNYLYGSMGEFRKSNFGRLRIGEEGTSLEQVWSDLCEQYPELFRESTNDGDMISEVLSVLDGLRPTYRNAYGEDIEQASYDLALTIYKEMSGVPQKATFKDKAEAAVEQEWKEANRVYLQMLTDFRKECEKQFLEGLKVSMNEQIKNKNQRIREAYEKIRDYANVIETTQNGQLIKKYQHEIEKQKRYIERLKKGQDKKIAEMKMENRQYRKNLSEQRKQTENKNKIRRLHKQMRQMLLNPTKTMYVPKNLVTSTIAVCEAVNLGAKEGTELYKLLDKTRIAFESMKADPVYGAEYDSSVSNYIDYIKSKLDGRNIYELTSQELEQVYEAMKQVYETIRRSTKLIRKEKYEDVKQEGERVINELKEADGLSEWAKSHKIGREFSNLQNKLLNPYRFFRRISGYQDGALMRAYEDLNDGQRKMLRIQQEAEAITSKKFTSKEMLKLMRDMDKKKGLVDTGLRYKDGSKVEITKGMRLAIIMHGMNKDNLKHMRYGGLVVPDMNLYVKGDVKGAYEGANVKTIKITKAQIDAMESLLSTEEKQMLASFKTLFHEYTGKVINDTSLELYGYKKATQENYYPIKVNKDFVKANMEMLEVNKTIEGAGFLKSRVDSTVPIMLESIITTAESTIKGVSQFGGLAIPLRNFNKLINATNYELSVPEDASTLTDSEKMVPTESVKEWLKKTWGDGSYTYIENMLADLQGARNQPPNILDKIRSSYAFAVLTGNVSTVIKQLSAFPTMAATVGWGNTVKALFRGGKNNHMLSRADRELIDKYTPILWDRNRGNSTKELADIKNMGSLAELPVLKQAKNAIQAVDVAVVGRFWYAAQYFVDGNYKELKKGTDQYYEKVAEIFNRTVEETQSMNTVMQSSDLLRSPKQGTKMILMFMSQNLQNYGIMYDSYMNLRAQVKRGDKEKIKLARKEFARAWSSQIVSAMTFSALAIVARAVLHKMNTYRDDENEITSKRILEQWNEDFVVAMLGSIPLADKLYELIMAMFSDGTYYDLEVATIQSMNDVASYSVQAAKAIKKKASDDEKESAEGTEELIKSVKKLAGNIGNLSGVPVTNVLNVVDAMEKHWNDITKGEGFLSFSTDKEEPKSTVYGEKIYEALMDGDKELAKEYREKMKATGTKGEGDAESAVLSQLAENNDLVKQAAEYRLNSNTDGYMNLYRKLKEKGFKHYEIVGAVNRVMNKMSNSTSSGPKDEHDYLSMYKSADLIRAIEQESGYEEILQQMYKEKIDAGKEDKEARGAIRAAVTKEYKDKYKACKNAHEKQKILKKMYLLKIDGTYLYDNGILEKWNND